MAATTISHVGVAALAADTRTAEESAVVDTAHNAVDIVLLAVAGTLVLGILWALASVLASTSHTVVNVVDVASDWDAVVTVVDAVVALGQLLITGDTPPVGV